MSDNNTHGERVKRRILAAGLALWRDGCIVSARSIGRELGMSHSAILYHFATIDGLRLAVAREAVRVGDPAVVPMLITAKHEAAAALGEAERRRFLAGC